MKKENIISILDGIIRAFIVIVTYYSIFWMKNILIFMVFGTIISSISLIYTYKKNIGKVGMSYFLSIFTESVIVGIEFFTGIIGSIVKIVVSTQGNELNAGGFFLLAGYLSGFIIITSIIRISLGIIEFVRWIKK